MVNLEDLLIDMVERNSSDLFVKAGSPPNARIDGHIVAMDYGDLAPADTERFAQSIMNETQWRAFSEVPEMDLAIGLSGVGRFRVNCFRQRGSVSMVLRHVSNPEFSFEQLHLPAIVRTLSEKLRGMTLVTGMTGSGKSTTLAAMINHINEMRKCHIVTVEDPIEFLHHDKVAIINQREVGFDTMTFSDALKYVLRQSPDVILIGEMRDLETIQTAISAAETGHLVFSTLHTTDAVQTVERIINYFPAYLHNQIRMELSLCLNGIVCQRLLPRKSTQGRVPAIEVMVNTPMIKKLLLEGRTPELVEHIAEGEYYGMQTFNRSLIQLIQQNLISQEVALAYATSPEELRLALEGVGTGIKSGGLNGGISPVVEANSGENKQYVLKTGSSY
jgi:twitching motility protein PilT